MLRQCKDQIGYRAPLVAGVSGLSTAEAVQLAQAAAAAGCDALMVLPQFVYRGDWRETETHLGAVILGNSAAVHALQQPRFLRY